MNCPHCTATSTKERAKKMKLGYATFFCPKCQPVFNERTGTPFPSLAFPPDVVLLAVLWRLRSKRSLRDVAELFLARGFPFTHEAIRDWEARFAPLITEQWRTKRRGQAGYPGLSMKPTSKCMRSGVMCIGRSIRMAM